MEPQLIAIICVSAISSIILILVSALLIVKKVKNKKLKKFEETGEIEFLNLETEMSKISKIVSNCDYLMEGIYSFNFKNFESGPILVNSYGLFVINEFGYKGKSIQGSFNSREWFIFKEKAKYYIYNPFWKLNKNIQDFLPMLPKNLPVIGILSFNNINNFDIDNVPSHLSYTSLENFYEFFIDIKKNLKPVLSAENVQQIIKLLKLKRV
ncbi:hypothetical protein DMC14_001240 [Metamycoplasma phocicerebrale]|uniref:NERD domain-containing protein n=1 Tax=Metamycoplasma phocicerebrale TaxID=142649 RepID=A0A3T0TTR5_9BACT|nr:hypothetical protein [Metamycoplasma phocicerebrale]AZZ65413.1 hypothetical protein DMC14_001240 [Metamycoplasma phocicerebrale]